VWGYNDWIKAVEGEGRWDAVNWGKDGKKSGAKSVMKSDNKLVYKY